MRHRILLLLLILTAGLTASTHAAQTGVVTLDTANPVVLALTPAGGTVKTGDAVSVTWTAADNHPPAFPIALSWRESESHGWQTIAAYEPNDSLFSWTAPQAYTEDARVRITMTDAFGNTACSQCGPFTILPGYNAASSPAVTLDTVDPVVTVTCPTADSVFTRSDPLPIRWSLTETNAPDSCLYLDWRRHATAEWDSITGGVTPTGAYDWVTPADSTAHAAIRVSAVDAFGNTGAGLSDEFTILQPMANFTADVTAGYVPLTVHFTDTSIGQIGARQWDFDNDGVIDSTEPNPTWTYLFPRNYTVSLTVTFSDERRVIARRESDSEVKTGYIAATVDSTLMLRVPAGYATIQAAIDAAADGDYVIVADGIYYENLQIVDKEITLASEYFLDGDTLHVDATTIDGTPQGRDRTESSVIAIKTVASTGLSAHIIGFTITHGMGRTITQTIGGSTVQKTVGGGIYIEYNDPVFTKNNIVENDATDEGGGSYALYGNPNFGGSDADGDVVNPGENTFRGNSADVGRDLYIVSDDTRDEIAVENCDFNVFCQSDTTVTAYWSTSNAPVNYTGGRGEHNAITQDIWVAVDGSDYENTGLSAASPFLTIDHALSMAYGSADCPVTVHLAPGTYAPYTTSERFPLQMVSHVSLVGSGVDETFIDACADTDNPNRVITLDNVVGCELRDLTICGGVVTASKGMNGAGIAGFGADVQLWNVYAANMSCEGDGGAGFFANSTVCCDSLFCSGNAATGNGGGLYAESSTLTLRSSTLCENTAHYGGGLYVSAGALSIDACEFSDNTTSGSQRWGGGILLDGCDSTFIADTDIVANQADFGAGICLKNCNGFRLIGNMIVNNLQSLTSYSAGGGGIYWNSACSGLLANNLVANNQAFQGGAGMGQSALTFLNNTMANNRATYKGGAFYLNACSPTYGNNIIWGNTANSGGNQFWLQTNSSDPTITYCDVQGGTAAFGLSTGTYTGTYGNNLNANPLFTSPTTGAGYTHDALAADWSLQEASPCRDTGDPATDTTSFPTDLAGNARVSNTVIDMGAYEYQVILALDSPQNIVLAVTDTALTISWDAVPNAATYRVFTDTAPAGDFSGEVTSTGVFTEVEERVLWTAALPIDDKRFYMVRATDEVVRIRQTPVMRISE